MVYVKIKCGCFYLIKQIVSINNETRTTSQNRRVSYKRYCEYFFRKVIDKRRCFECNKNKYSTRICPSEKAASRTWCLCRDPFLGEEDEW